MVLMPSVRNCSVLSYENEKRAFNKLLKSVSKHLTSSTIGSVDYGVLPSRVKCLLLDMDHGYERYPRLKFALAHLSKHCMTFMQSSCGAVGMIR